MKKYSLVFISISIVLVISGCGIFSGSLGNDLNGTSWTLESYGGKSLLGDRAMTAIFESKEVSGSASCNHYFGAYKISGNQFSVDGLGWTEMACMDPEGIMQQEQEIMAMLGDSASYMINGDNLIISTSNGDQLVFLPLEITD
jgi:heat shock protein HslJ